MSPLSVAQVQLPIMLSEISGSSKGKQRAMGPAPFPSLPPESSILPERHTDLEYMGEPSVMGREAGERDPLLLRERIMTGEAIEELRQGNPDDGGLKIRLDCNSVILRDKARRSGKKVAAFYEDQNEHIDTLLKPLSTLSAEGEQDAADNAFRVKLAVNISFGCNCILSVLQLYAAISSGSLALFATMVDSVFDPLANLVLWLAHRAASEAEERRWPLGGSRFETAGNIVFGHLMFAVNLILVVQSIREFAEHDSADVEGLNIPSIVVVCCAFGVKLSLFAFCFAIRKWSSQVQVLWEDHRNDLFTNGFGILAAAGGGKIAWWIDPMGAMIIALVVMSTWSRTIYSEFKQLCGIAAPAEYQNLVTYKAMTFSPEIISIDTVKIYHSGPQYFVEIDIVLPPDMPLWRAHDIAQDLQDQIEALPDVDRCFVHVDHEVDHKPEHRKKV